MSDKLTVMSDQVVKIWLKDGLLSGFKVCHSLYMKNVLLPYHDFNTELIMAYTMAQHSVLSFSKGGYS